MSREKVAQQTLIVSPGDSSRMVIDADGNKLQVPHGWQLLPRGDAGLTRRVKAGGPTWTVKQRKGRRLFSKGVWAHAQQIAAAKQSVAADRSKPAYAKRLQSDARRREKQQDQYVSEFETAVRGFLRFDQRYHGVESALAKAVTVHATPVGSGTVARTKRIPITQRAESAVIAWMRHQTTAYDHLDISRAKGERRDVRRKLAEQSRKLLRDYRSGKDLDGETCPLQMALRMDRRGQP